MTPEAMTADVRAELLNRLGLPANAGPGHIEAAYRSAVSMLERLPAEQQDWAEGQKAELDAIRSLLLEAPAVASPATASGAAVTAGDAVTSETAPASRRRIMIVSGIALLVVIIGAVVFAFVHNSDAVPGITGTPTNTASASASASLNMQAVAAEMQKISKDPKDFTALMNLAGLYFQAGDYKNSAHFSEEATAVKPKSDTAWTALGAAQFNLGQGSDAATSWKKAVAINPKNAEAYYDLGFYYLSGSSPNLAMVKKMWETVVAINPSSDLAKNVKTHLSSLSSASGAPTPSASGK